MTNKFWIIKLASDVPEFDVDAVLAKLVSKYLSIDTCSCCASPLGIPRQEWIDSGLTYHGDNCEICGVEEHRTHLNKEAGVKDWVLPLVLAPGLISPSEVPAKEPSQQHQPAVGWQHYDALIDSAANRHGVPADMFKRLLHTENTTGNPHATSGKGAIGLAQLMPETAESLGVDPHNPHASIDAAARYLRALYRQFGNWEHAVEAYNFGPGNLQKFLQHKIKPSPNDKIKDLPSETKKYVKDIQPPKL